jgi:hypothetical protein
VLPALIAVLGSGAAVDSYTARVERVLADAPD